MSIQLSLSLAAVLSSQPAAELADQAPIEQVLIHPLYDGSYSCSEHWAGQLPSIGDALGVDCYRTGPIETPDGGVFYGPYRTNGLTNEDWFSWRAPVLAPFAGEIVRVNINPAVNQPGQLGSPPSSFIIVRGDDGVMALYAHIAEPRVGEGDRVEAGEVMAVVGNNGFGRSPHIHVGAWRDRTPLQIRFDQRAMAALMAASATD